MELKIEENIEMDRCYRVSSKNKIRTCQQTIFCRISIFKDKQKMLGNTNALKDTDIFIYEDFCKNTTEISLLVSLYLPQNQNCEEKKTTRSKVINV